MATVPVVKRVFNSGEFSPKVYGRTDVERYDGGCKKLLNFLPIPQGGFIRRPGTQYVATAAANNVRLIPFQFSTTQAYILEFGQNYMRVFKDRGIVLGNNNAVYSMNHTIAWNDLQSMHFAQSFDTLYLVGNNFAPKQVQRTAHNNWTIADVTWTQNNNNVTPAPWSNNNGWPRAISFYQDRLVLGGTAYKPHQMWFSCTSEYNNLTYGTNDSDAFRVSLLSGQADVIHWLSSHKSLIVGCDSGVWSVASARGSATAISPVNRRADKESYFGTTPYMPARLGEHIIYPQYLSGKIRDISYQYEIDGYPASEISVLADHLLEGYTVHDLAYQQSPFEIVWVRRSDGALLALTYLYEHKVIGWSQHNFGNVSSIASIPGNSEGELWMAVQRTVNNNNVTYIECMDQFYLSGMNNAHFVDSYIAGTANNNVVSGLNHLEGRTVQFLADGVPGNATVNNGNVAAMAASNIVIGLGYNSVYESLPIEIELKSGPSMFKTKRITGMGVRVRNSAGGSYGPNNNYQTQLLNNNSGNLFTGDYTNLSIRGGHDTHRTIVVKQTEPFPMAIDAIGLDVEVE